jgi:nicotinate-nucleotide pyrophosphorylase (carboxylating)
MNPTDAPNLSLEPAIAREAVVRALGEDRGPMDITSHAVVPEEQLGAARIITRENCVIAGLLLADLVFREVEPAARVTLRCSDGDRLQAGAVALEVTGPVRGILTAERTVLNFLQQLSGVATLTRAFVEAISGTKAKILDTRKTAPGLRALQKYAVRCGGGFNHRLGLYDKFLLKDNHLARMGPPEAWAAGVKSARSLKPDAEIEIEADTLEQVKIIAELGVDMIMLDNMSIDDMRKAVDIIGGRAKTEASGGIGLERVRAVAETGVDFISVGALTHSARAIDLSLEMVALAPKLSQTAQPPAV